MSDLTNQEFPKFISSTPTGDDIFEGQSQEKISSTIFKLIKEKSLTNNVMGLEGKWGSGKSNVIENLRGKFDNCDLNYDFFTYDAWGHQEDLTRKTFLEELIFQLKINDRFNENIDWEEELKKLLAKKSTKNTYKFPKIKFYWILITTSILLFSFFDIVHEDFLSSMDIIKSYSNPKLKLFLVKYLFPAILFVWGIVELFKGYFEYDKDEKTKSLKWKERLKRLFYVFSGNDIETEELENIFEEEPSVRQFKVYFEKIINDLKSEGLIIVFDNMDRLSHSTKVLSLWSSIYTFFSEEKKANVWVIIPYDKEHLSGHFGEGNNEDIKTDNFIGKTFSTIFRISPPVLSDWKRFFDLKFKEAFGSIYNDEEIEFISSLYEIVFDLKNRRPRDIITFVNNLVSLSLQHNSSVDIKYLALFLLRKKEILENPLTAISTKSFMQGEKYLFMDEKELEQNIASIVYNVDKEKANEVLLRNSIEDMFIRPDLEVLKQIKDHSDFKTYLDNVIQKSDFSRFMCQNVSLILEEVKDTLGQTTIRGYWEKFANSIDNKTESEFITFKDWHKNTLLNVSKKTGLKLSNRIVQTSFENYKQKKSTDYYVTIHDLLDFIKKKSLDINPNVKNMEFSPTDFLSYIDDFSHFSKNVSLQEMNISSDLKELDDYFIHAETGMINVTHEWLHVIDYLIKKDKKVYKFNDLSRKIEEQIPLIAYNKKDDIDKIVEILKVLNGKKEHKAFETNFLNNYLNTYGNEDDGVYFNIIANYISLLGATTPTNQYLLVELNRIDNSDKIAEIIQYYINYGDLLKIIIDSGRNYALLKELAKKLTTNSYGFTQTLSSLWVYENIGRLQDNLFNKDIEIFLSSFEGWSQHFQKRITDKNVFDIGTPIIDLVYDFGVEKFKSLKHYYEVASNKLKTLDEDTWAANFSEPDHSVMSALDCFMTNGLLNTSITKSPAFMSAYEKYLKNISKREIDVPANKDFWNGLLENDCLDNRKLKRIYNDILDLLLDNSELDISEIMFFSYGLFNYATNISETHKADEFIRKIILPMEDNNILIETFPNQIIKVINSASSQYHQELYDLLIKINDIVRSSSINLIISKTKLKELKESIIEKESENEIHEE
ncbi:NTPase [Yeosuana aromativorans]|uniref:NTPase n=1 Tax=Yeosuana aromativorans TaxID=288019 RepID=A0A8J3FF16_9FLAO|nr:P-loop NTPase fold protein [Yeosuana aromativorans]GGK11024.1 NTPase [Yeosuana aromativorans]